MKAHEGLHIVLSTREDVRDRLRVPLAPTCRGYPSALSACAISLKVRAPAFCASRMTTAFLMRSRAPTSRKRFDAHFGAIDNRAVDAVAVIRDWHVVPVAVDRALEADHQRYAIF